MADHQPQALGWGEGREGEGLLGDGDGAWVPGRGEGGDGSGRWGWDHAAQVHTQHIRQPITPGPAPVLLGSPAGAGGLVQGHCHLGLQATVGAAASPLVQGDASSTEKGEHGGPPGLGATASPGTHPELGLRQPLEPEG